MQSVIIVWGTPITETSRFPAANKEPQRAQEAG